MSIGTLNKIIAKLGYLEEYLRYLKEIQKVNEKKFINDYLFFGAAERFLQLAIEAILDIGKLIIISGNFRRAEDNSDILNVVLENKVIKESLANKLNGMARFRNLLVHEYEKIEHKKVYKKLKENLGGLVDFKRQISRFLKKKDKAFKS